MAALAVLVLSVVASTLIAPSDSRGEATWTVLGGRLNGEGACCLQARVGTGPSGAPVIAWVEHGTNGKLLAAGWDGASWQPYGGPLATGDPTLLDLEVGADGQPMVAWADGTSVSINRWMGQGWPRRRSLCPSQARTRS